MLEADMVDGNNVRLIGYWRSERDPRWPDPKQFVDPGWDEDELLDVVLHLRHGLVAKAYMGQSVCRLCGARVGDLELTDGVYIWPEGLDHYVEHHAVRLPPEFVQHVRRLHEQLEQLAVDESWWRSMTGGSPAPASTFDLR